MNKIITAVTLLAALTVYAYDIDALIKKADPEKTYDDANAINVFTEVIYDINRDGSFVHKVFYVKKILNYSGQSRYSDVSIEYDPEFEKVELVTTLTVTPEGEKLEVPENQIYDLNTDESLWSPEYIKHRKKVINFPQIGPGYFIVLEYHVTNTRKLPLSGIEHFRESNPYLEKNLVIKYPKGMEIKYHAHPDLKLTKGKNELKWSIADSPLIKNEPNSPDYLNSGTPVIFTFYKDWNEYVKSEFLDILNYETSDKVKDLSSKITAGIETDDAKVQAIYKFLAQNYDSKYCYISLMDMKPEPLDKVLENKYGSTREMTALFIALAEQAGIKDCKPALKLSSSFDQLPAGVEKFVLKDLIEEVYVYRNGEMFKPGEKTRAFGYCDTYDCSIVLPDQPGPVKYSYILQPQIERTYELDPQGKDVIAKISSVNRGGSDSWMRSFERMPEEERNIRFFQWLVRDNSAELIEYPVFDSFDNLTDPIKVNFKIKRNGAVIDQDSYSYFVVSGFESLPDVSLKERTNDLRINSRIFNRYKYIVNSSGKEVINLTASEKKFECSGLSSYIKTEVQKEGAIFTYSVEYYIPEMTVPKEKYPQFRDFLMDLKNPVSSAVFMEAGK
ncbi:MAG: DUF3857 and transglutaminase domain-containing protein [Candidatus Delongbacteria bacterium]|jgi:transglutaminase-like putative cysteine protease|nr:DUF3857 and transglutaminase domain-containing protein [Candidatus Delongbacteria bacterium]